MSYDDENVLDLLFVEKIWNYLSLSKIQLLHDDDDYTCVNNGIKIYTLL